MPDEVSLENEVPQDLLPVSLRRPGDSIVTVPGHVKDTSKQRRGTKGNRAEKPPPRPQAKNLLQGQTTGDAGSNKPSSNGNGDDSDSDSGSDSDTEFESWGGVMDLNPLFQARISMSLDRSSPWKAHLQRHADHQRDSGARVRSLLGSAQSPQQQVSAPSSNEDTVWVALCNEVATEDAALQKYLGEVVFDEIDKEYCGRREPVVSASSWNSDNMDEVLREVEMALVKRCRRFDRSGKQIWSRQEVESAERVDVRLTQMVLRMMYYPRSREFSSDLNEAMTRDHSLAARSPSRQLAETIKRVSCPVDPETSPAKKLLVHAYLRVIIAAVAACVKNTPDSTSLKTLIHNITQSRLGTSGALSPQYKDWLRLSTTDEHIAACQLEWLARREKSHRLRGGKYWATRNGNIRYEFLESIDRPGVVTLAVINRIEGGAPPAIDILVAIKEVLPDDLPRMGWRCDVRPDGSVGHWRRERRRAVVGGKVQEGIFKVAMGGEVLSLLHAPSHQSLTGQGQ